MLHSSTNAGTAFPARQIAAGMATMIVLLLVSTGLTWRVGHRLLGATESQIAVLTAAERVEHYGTVLELSIKAVVDHGDPEAAKRYRAVQPRLRTTLTNLRDRVQTPEKAAAAAEVDRADLQLVALEYAALDLAGRGEIGEARRLIRSDRYHALIDIYYAGTRRIAKHAERFVAQSRADANFYLRIIVAMSAASLLLVLIGWFALIRPARRWGDHLDRARMTAESSAHQLEKQQAELEMLNRKFFDQARTDPLTGLHTRLKFNEDIEQLWPRIERRTQSYCAVMCDVDFFKQYNDSYGHLAGDDVLRQVAAALTANRRAGDQLYRMGGEEFLVILHGCKARDAITRADHFRAAVEALEIAHVASPLGRVTLSIGTSCVGPGRSTTLQNWLGEADAAMYEAKAAGRNTVVTREKLAA